MAGSGDREGDRRGLLASWPLLVFAFGVAASFLVWRLLLGFDARVIEAEFTVATDERLDHLLEHIEETSTALDALASLYAVSGDVSQAQFSRFAAPILARRHAIRALGWNPVVSRADRAAHEASVRATGRPDYGITVRSPEGPMVPAPVKDQYVAVARIAPLETNLAALGFDVSSDSVRRNALEEARDLGRIMLGGPVELVQDSDRGQAALLFLPSYEGGGIPATVEERQARIEGFFVAVVVIADVVDAAFRALDPASIDVHVSFGSPADGAKVAYTRSASDSHADPPVVADRLHRTARFDWGGREVNLLFVATEDPTPWAPHLALAAGLLLTTVLTAGFALLRGRAARIEREVEERTRELQAVNRGLEQEVVQRKLAEATLASYRDRLEEEVAGRTSELESATRRLRTIVDSGPECVKIVNARGELLEMNPAGLAMVEADSLDQVRGRSIVSLIVPEHRDAFIELNRRVIAGERQTLEFEFEGLRGSRCWVETHAVPILDAQGRENQQLAITRDITARKRAEEERGRLEQQLRQAQKLESLGVLAGGIAHDFNNLLQVVAGNCEVALEEIDLDSNARKSIESSISAAESAAALCNQLLAYAGQARQVKGPIDLSEHVRGIVALLDVSKSKKVRLELDCDDDLPVIEGDAAQLHQVIMNLVTNAADAIGDRSGRVTIRTWLHSGACAWLSDGWLDAEPEPGEYVCLSVRDTGCGMDRETLEKIFDPFFTTKFTGRGLGLASALGIVRSHEGYIGVESAPGRGTTFTISLPVSQVARPLAPREPRKQPVPFEGIALIIDDEAPVRDVGRRLLQSVGFDVLVAARGTEAIRIVEERGDGVRVVLLDLTMPGLDGLETREALLRLRPSLPIILCSGYARDAVSGPDAEPSAAFIQKPFRRSELLQVLADVLAPE